MGLSKQSNKRRRTTCKTGCRTCKIRKVKCDEGRPACARCVSTGRVCDGYGIWGGGGNEYGNRQPFSKYRSSQVIASPSRCIVYPCGTSKERQYFEWFKLRSIKKLPGPFVLNFWETLLLQASSSEPAVFHAVVTLSSVHKSVVYIGDQSRSQLARDQEQFILQNYSKAIAHLQPHFSTKDKASERVALIACVIFTCLELLRGNFETAQTHLKNGLQIIQQSQDALLDDGVLTLKPALDPADERIAEAFSRFCLQKEMFMQTYKHPITVFQSSLEPALDSEFRSVENAWSTLERLFHRTLHLTEKARQQQYFPTRFLSSNTTLLTHQQVLQNSLLRWHTTYNLTDIRKLDNSGFVYHLLSEYHAMASIMASTCLQDECAFDTMTPLFLRILSHSIRMWKERNSSPHRKEWPLIDGRSIDLSHSMIDMGWIPPLYYTATRCRIHRIRLHAVQLLEYTMHREGIWDSRIAAAVAREVMQIEEGDFFKDEVNSNQFEFDREPSVGELVSPTLPLEQRLAEVKVVMGDDVAEKVLMEYRRVGTNKWEHLWIPVRYKESMRLTAYPRY